jgi:hypothetical protein
VSEQATAQGDAEALPDQRRNGEGRSTGTCVASAPSSPVVPVDAASRPASIDGSIAVPAAVPSGPAAVPSDVRADTTAPGNARDRVAAHAPAELRSPRASASSSGDNAPATVPADRLVAALFADPIVRARGVDVSLLASQLRSHGVPTGITDERWLACIPYALGELHESAIDGTASPGRLLLRILQRVGAPRQLEQALKHRAEQLKPRESQHAKSRFAPPAFDAAEFAASEVEQVARLDREAAERAEADKAKERSRRVGGVATGAPLFALTPPAALTREREPDRSEARPGLRSAGTEPPHATLLSAPSSAKEVAQ